MAPYEDQLIRYVGFCTSKVIVPITFADRLRKARKSIGLSQTNAAKKAGISLTYWFRVESGRNRPEKKYKKRLKRCEILYNAYARYAPDAKWNAAVERLREARARVERFADAVNTTVEFLVDGPALPPQQNNDQEMSCNPSAD